MAQQIGHGYSSGTARRFAAAALAFVLFLLAPLAASAESAPIALDMRVAGDEAVTRIVIEFDKPVEVSHRLLDRPWRLVLDFNKIGYGFDAEAVNTSGLVSGLRYGDMGGNHSRLIFRTRHPFKIASIESRPDRETSRHNVVIDLVAAGADEFADAMDRSLTTGAVVNSVEKRDRLGSVRQDDRPFTIIIDPGHGGIDNGAKGVRGTLEKDVVLEFARTLRDRLSRYDGAQVFMTRDSDVFVSLSDRTVFAREHQADLFISVHADSLRQHGVRGATVYTISEKASDEVAAAVAANENLADSVAGVENTEEFEGVSDILVDLARRETLGFSVQFARLAISDMKGFARLIKNPHRYAGFRVLKAPDVPSVLIELGYLSNKDDEHLLNQKEWQNGLADRLANAIEKFAALSSRDIESSVAAGQ
ncbi:MAG: N-acetylmuramoyl-L-alanine amidase [Ahrensia sp.]|nr:N-acetylmuramoyl-L-alanine amidase [Ahrensia sp.]|tara:strand:+ start:45453 stop:46712 length:1260 start_codon:yes stop_codon:yes gene_type:complete